MKKVLIDFLLDLNDRGLINNYDFDYEKVAQDFIADVSVSLLRKKAKEYAKFIYAEGYNDPMYHPEVMQTMSDFEAGFKAGMHFYNER